MKAVIALLLLLLGGFILYEVISGNSETIIQNIRSKVSAPPVTPPTSNDNGGIKGGGSDFPSGDSPTYHKPTNAK